MGEMLTRLFLRLSFLVLLDVGFIGTLVWALLNEDFNWVTIICLYGAIAHTHLAPTAKELALIKGKKS
jgi:hypothetical protein